MLCAPSLAGESFGMVLTEAFAAGTAVVASAIAGYSDVVTDGVDGVLVPPADPQALAEELQRLYARAASGRGDGRGRPPQRRALRLAADRRARSSEVYERAVEPAPAPDLAAGGDRPPDGPRPDRRRPEAPAKRLPSLEPLPATAAAAPALARKAGVAVASILGVGLTALAAQPDRGRPGGRAASSAPIWLGADRLRADGRPRCSCAPPPGRDRPRRAAPPTAAPPRRDLGDDDRRADVGDAAGPPRRAGARDGPRPPHRPDARDLPGAARHAGLADRPQHPRAGPARRDHRLAPPTSSTRAPRSSSWSRPRRCSSCWRVLMAPSVVKVNGAGPDRPRDQAVRGALLQVRTGLTVFRDPRKGSFAAGAQLFAWVAPAARLLGAVRRARTRPPGRDRRRGGRASSRST